MGLRDHVDLLRDGQGVVVPAVRPHGGVEEALGIAVAVRAGESVEQARHIAYRRRALEGGGSREAPHVPPGELAQGDIGHAGRRPQHFVELIEDDLRKQRWNACSPPRLNPVRRLL